MSLGASRIKGWCPTPLRPMRSGDGLLTRLNPPRAGYDGATLQAIAELSMRFGNGQIEITQRRNLQLRGISETGFETYLALAEISGLIDRETGPPVMVAPSPVFDATAQSRDVEIERFCSVIASFEAGAFPAKFVVAIGLGGELGPDDLSADLRLDAEGEQWRIGLCGSLKGGAALGVRTTEETAIILDRLLRHYPSTNQRGKGLDFARSWAQAAGYTLAPTSFVAAKSRRPDHAIFPAFGRIEAADLARLGKACAGLYVSVLPGPERSLLLSTQESAHVDAIADCLPAASLIRDAADPKNFISVCAGAPACEQAARPSLADAHALSAGMEDVLNSNNRLHVSGCGKGCAHPARTAFTLAAEEGRYRFARNATAAEAIASGQWLDSSELVMLVREMERA